MRISHGKSHIYGAAILMLSAANFVQAAGLDDAKAGLDALNRGDNAAAITLFSKAISSGQLSPMDRELAYVKRAQAYMSTGQSKLAISDLDQAQKLDPNDQEIASLRQKTTPRTQAAAPARTAGPSAGPSGAGPRTVASVPSTASLKDTMAFLQQAIATQGVVNIEVHTHESSGAQADGIGRLSIEKSNVTTDPSFCRVDYHEKGKGDGDSAATEADRGFSLSSVLSVQRLSMEEQITLQNAKAGFPNWSAVQVNPPTAVVKIVDTAGSESLLLFADPDLADRVSRAVRHASDLCGAKPPF